MRHIRQIALQREQVEAGDQVAVKEVRIGHGQVDGAASLGKHTVQAGVDAGTEQVALSQTGIHEKTRVRRVAAAQRQLAGRLLIDIGVDDGLVGRRSGLVRHLHRIEVAEVLQSLT